MVLAFLASGLCLGWVLRAAAYADAGRLGDAFSHDDECFAAADGEACAVNALQSRAVSFSRGHRAEDSSAVASGAASDAASAAGAARDDSRATTEGEAWLIVRGGIKRGLTFPAYCTQTGFKDAKSCLGERSCECQVHCTTSDKSQWAMDVTCCGCDGAALLQGATRGNSKTAASAASDGSTGAVAHRLGRWWIFGGGGLQHPTYCNQPQMAGTPMCEGDNTCACQDYCQGSDKNGWGVDPQCCGCDGASLTQVTSLSQVVGLGTGKWWFWPWWPFGGHHGSGPGLKNPKYCEAAQFADSPWCKGDNTCACQDYCTTSDSSSWGMDPQCCGCSGASLLQADGKKAGEWWWIFGGGGGLTHPKYCDQDVMKGTPFCQGDNTCSCVDYCATSDKTEWAVDPQCCGCDGAALLQRRPVRAVGGAA